MSSYDEVEYITLEEKLPGIKIKSMHYPLIKYGTKGKRILIICDHVPREDTKELPFTFLGNDTGDMFSKALDFAFKDASVKLSKVLAIPFLPVNFKSFNMLSGQEQGVVISGAITRINNIVAKFKPDCVLISGFDIAQHFIGNYAYKKLGITEEKLPKSDLKYLRGRVLATKFGDYKSKAVITFSIRHVMSQDYKDFKSTVNLVGYFCRDLSAAMLGENRYTLPNIEDDSAILITNLKQWKSFYNKLLVAKTPTIDTETMNLNRIVDNKLYTIQFCLDGKVAYILPWHHPETPFKHSELQIIQADLVDYFENTNESQFDIYQNPKFDITQFRRALNIKFYKSRIWDIAAGEYFLEEHRKFFNDAGLGRNKEQANGPFSLSAIVLSYGGFAYLDGEVGKKDRKDLGSKPLIEVAKYGAKDVILPWHICRFQLAEAKRRGEDYAGYAKSVAELGSDMAHVFTDMEFSGTLVDKDYLQSLMLPNSAVAVRIRNATDAFRKSVHAQAVNDILIKESGNHVTQGLFGRIEKPWLFKINDQRHQQMLYYNEMQLTPLEYKKNGGGKLGKAFLAEYKGIFEVDLLQEYNKLTKMIGTYVKGIYKHLATEPDMADRRLRASYDFLRILTVRTSANSPNLQAMPSHGDDAKIIKRQFISQRGKIQIKADFNAHEVRGWGNISNDPVIAKSFSEGIVGKRNLRIWTGRNQKKAYALADWLIKKGWFDKVKDDSGKKKDKFSREAKIKLAALAPKSFREPLGYILHLEVYGDIHRMNYSYFYGIPANEVNDSQRQDIKGVVFGVLYGLGAESLSRNTNPEEWKRITKLYPDYEEMRETKEYKAFKKRGQDLIDKLFSTMKIGGDWIKHVHQDGKRNYLGISVFGPVRHLWGYMHNQKQVHGMMNRRGPNSLVQGPSSNLIYSAMRIMQKIQHEVRKTTLDLGFVHQNIVHDSCEAESDIITLPISLYYLEHALTSQVANRCRKTYNWDMPIALEIEIELGANHARMSKYNFTELSLLTILDKEIDWQNENLGYSLNKRKILKKVEHNFRIVNDFRLNELEKRKKKFSPERLMTMYPNKLKNLNLIWS